LTSSMKRRRQMISDVDAGNYAPRSVPAWTERTDVG